MAVNSSATLAWESAAGDDLAMLQDLQPNILKGHARDFLSVLFLKFGETAEASACLGALAGLMKSAHDHLSEVRAFKATGTPGTPYIGVGISARGYAVLGVASAPADPSFVGGMQAAGLDDDHSLWEAHFLDGVDAVVLAGDASAAGHDAALAQVLAVLAAHPGIRVMATQPGLGLHNANGDGIEHFGYVDGRSQPLFLDEDVRSERLSGDGATTWDPAFALDRAIVADPAAPDPTKAFGSYFIFRKLEQDVMTFKQQEDALADALGLQGGDRERAGAMIVGRFEDGTPVTAQKSDGDHAPVPNDFNYASDDDGGKCPFFGHIRKLNPRGSGGFGVPPAQERLHLMARRGQTYGTRADNPNDGETSNKPTGGVGLLFMAFNVNIAEQFEFTQIRWANSDSFPEVPGGAQQPGLDLVIGQSASARPQVEAPVAWGSVRTTPADFQIANAPAQAVRTRGGEYFFMPSLSFLRSQAPGA